MHKPNCIFLRAVIHGRGHDVVNRHGLGRGDAKFVRIVAKGHDGITLLVGRLGNGGGIERGGIGVDGIDRVALAPVRVRGRLQDDDLGLGHVKYFNS
jgi:hypothetical protein